MKVKARTATDKKLVLAGMIGDTSVCSRVASQWSTDDVGLFDDEDSNLIAEWCLDHLAKYSEAPGERIQTIFESWAENDSVTDDKAIMVEKKLTVASREWDRNEGITSEYIIDKADAFFNKVRLKREWEEAELELDRGLVRDAYNRLTGISRVELGTGSMIKLNEAYELWRDVLSTDQEKPLLTYPGELNKFFGPVMARDNFVAFMAPDKSYKSWWIMDAGFRGIRNRHRVAFFEVGDMSRGQIMKRMATRFAKRPIWPGPYNVPKSLKRNPEGGFTIDWDVRSCDKRMTPQELFRRVEKICWRKDTFRLSCHANDSIDVHGIRSILNDWAKGGWVPDIVLVDYADILAAPRGIRDELNQIDATWKGLRRLSQELHCLVITATQSNAAAYTRKQKTLGKKHFSGRKTKLAHVTGMVGINVSDMFRKNCMSGLNWVVRREGRYTERWMSIVVGSLDIGNPAMKCLEKSEKSDETSE